jgi:hypothetical protein
MHYGGGIVARNYYEILTIETSNRTGAKAVSSIPSYVLVGRD